MKRQFSTLFTTLFIALYAISMPAVAMNPINFGVWSTFQAPQLEASKKTKKAKAANQGSRAKFDKGSGETTKERDRRLQRECKGRANAGACLGYAS